MATRNDVVPKAMDVTARSIDLLTVLAKVAQGTEAGSFIMKELGRWLGKEGLDENELQFFLQGTKGLIRPNDQTEVTTFFQAVTSREPTPSVIPLWAQPSGALGRYVSRDPHQRWITSTISCLFRYHDERFIKFVLCGLIMQSLRKGEPPLSEYQLAWHPDTLRLGEVVNKVVHSNWINIANAGLIGSESECPHLPEELAWACKKGHNIESYKLSLVMTKLLDPPAEIIFQSEHLLTNLVLWLLWHFNGRLRVIVSGRIEYDKALGPEKCTVECRVARMCSEEGDCASSKATPTFEMLESVSGSLKTLFRGKYDTQQTLMSEPRVRQKLYNSPFQYPKGSNNSIKIQTQRTAQEILRWYVERPITEMAFSSRLDFHISLTSATNNSSSKLCIGDLLGRTPGLLNMQCGELGRTFVVFSPPREKTPVTVENFMEMSSESSEDMDDIGDAFEDRPEILLRYFPILQDLVDGVRQSCKCFHCHRKGTESKFHFDEHCLQYKAFMDVMFFFAHGIADAFGAPDASSCCGEVQAGDSGATAILLDAIEGARMGGTAFEGVVRWNTLLSTSTQVFLGCPPLDKLTDATYNDAAVDVSPHFMQDLSAIVIAVQYGDLAVVAPWLDISHRLKCNGCFRFTVVQGRLGLPVQETSSGPILQELARDVAVLETQHTEDVSDYASRNKVQQYVSNDAIQLSEDDSQPFCDYVLVSMDQTRYKLLLRVSSKLHSRMVDPSRAMLKAAAQVFPVTCKHAKDRDGKVPDQWIAELFKFDELLGRWGDTTKRETVSTNNSPDLSDGDSGDDNILKQVSSNRTSHSVASKGKDQQAQKPSVLRISHLLKTSFEYNTALALTDDDPVFVNYGDACLGCSLKQATNFKKTDWRPSYARWIINCVSNLETSVPKPRLSVKWVEAQGGLERRTKRKLEISSASRDGIMELDE